jgi:hypothetical protein
MASNQVGFGIAGDQAYQQSQLNDQQMQMNSLAIGQAQRADEQAQADQDLDQQARQMMSKISLGQGSTPTADPSSNTADSMHSAFLQTAQKLMQLGAPKMAMEYYKNGATIGKDEQAAATSKIKNQQTAAETLLKQSDILGRTLGSATTQEEWNQGQQQLAQSGAFTPEQLATFQKIPYHPAAVQHLADQSMSVKDKAQMTLLSGNQQLTQQRDSVDAQYKATSLALGRARLEETKRRNTIDEKTGKAATAPTGPQIKSVKSAIVNQIFDGKEPPDDTALEAGAQDIASRAQTLVQGNKGLTWQTAVNRAVTESNNSGDWDIHKGGWFSDESVKFNGMGKTAEDALPLPTEGNKIDASALKKGRWYMTVQGRGQWDGTNFNVPD